MLLGTLASHDCTASAILGFEPCERLVSLLCDDDSDVILWAVYTLAQIARCSDGAEAIVDAKPLNHVFVLLQSPSVNVREWTCSLVGLLAEHDTTAPAILKPKAACGGLVSLLLDQDSEVIPEATYALFRIARWSDGAQAIVNTKPPERIMELLNSSTPDVSEWAFKLLERLGSHELTGVSPILRLEFSDSEQLVSLLRHPATRDRALNELCAISDWPDGVAAVAAIDFKHAP